VNKDSQVLCFEVAMYHICTPLPWSYPEKKKKINKIKLGLFHIIFIIYLRNGYLFQICFKEKWLFLNMKNDRNNRKNQTRLMVVISFLTHSCLHETYYEKKLK
jgi:hypothetical protein